MMHKICYGLMVIGALNWGLVGIFDFDLVAAIFGDMTLLSRCIYTVVGLAAVGSFFHRRKKTLK